MCGVRTSVGTSIQEQKRLQSILSYRTPPLIVGYLMLSSLELGFLLESGSRMTAAPVIASLPPTVQGLHIHTFSSSCCCWGSQTLMLVY